jgi:DNA-binding transcriptional MerR regulator
MSQTTGRMSLGDYLTVKDAASFLGVCPGTLRNWDRAGKLKPVRHPMNGYRLYLRSALDAVLSSLRRSSGQGEAATSGRGNG